MIWEKFKGNLWKENINVENFIRENYTEYTGDDSFLTNISDKTNKVWDKCQKLILEEMKKGIIDVDTVQVLIVLHLDTLIKIMK